MSNTGTNEAEYGLNGPKSEDELAELVLSAVSDGDAEELDRLFSVELSPDAAPVEEEDSNKDSDSNDGEEHDEATSDDPAAADQDDSSTSRTTAQEPTPAEQRLAKLEKELADAKAVAGRTAALQSRLAQLENQLKKQAANKQPDIDPEEKELDERIARLKEIDPDTAAIVEALRKRGQTTAAQSQDTSYDEEVVRQEYYKVLEVHHDADKIFNHPYWHQWKSLLTPDQRAWAESSESGKVIEALNEFKKFMQSGPATRQTPAQTVVPEVPVVEDVVDATKLAREKKLQSSATTSDAPVRKNAKLDEDALFLEAYEQAAKEANITY